MDFTLYDPAGRIIHSEVAVSSAEATVTGHGGQGPWRACFKVSRQQILRPSVIVRLSYFTVNSPTLVGTHFEWQRTPPEAGGIQLSPGGVTAGELGELLFVCVCVSGGCLTVHRSRERHEGLGSRGARRQGRGGRL